MIKMNLLACRGTGHAADDLTEQQQQPAIDLEMSIQEYVERFVDGAILSMEFLEDAPCGESVTVSKGQGMNVR